MKGREKEAQKCQGDNAPTLGDTRLTYRITVHAAYLDSKVGGSGCSIHLVDLSSSILKLASSIYIKSISC